MNPYSKMIKEGDTFYYVGRFENVLTEAYRMDDEQVQKISVEEVK